MSRADFRYALALIFTMLALALMREQAPPMVIYPASGNTPVLPEEAFRFTFEGYEMRNTI